MLRLQETSPISIAIALYSYFKSSKNHIHIRGRENQRTEHLACSHDDGGLSKLVGPFHVLLADDAVVWERALSPQQMEALALLQLAIASYTRRCWRKRFLLDEIANRIATCACEPAFSQRVQSSAREATASIL